MARLVLAVVLLLSTVAPVAQGFLPREIDRKNPLSSAKELLAPLGMASTTSTPPTTNDDSDVATTPRGLLQRDRYVATNRFAVRKDRQGKFEKRWATRKSRLASLPGFRYFHLMRRVTVDEETNECAYDDGYGGDSKEPQNNYVSFTIWNKKSDFSAWRKGDAFKEAHGGTSIGAFVSTMVSSAMVLKGAPRPAFYDGLLLVSVPPKSLPETVDGWRADLVADGVNTLPAECFVRMEQFFVPSDKAGDFEQACVQQQKTLSSTMSTAAGFVAFSLMRRDGQAKGHGMVEMSSDEPTYVATTIFQDLASFLSWSKARNDGNLLTKEEVGSFSSRDPQEVFYEGTLVISSKDGA